MCYCGSDSLHCHLKLVLWYLQHSADSVVIVCMYAGDIALGGEVVGQGEGHFKEDWKPKDLDLSQIFLSPSIKYAGCAAYSKPTK